MTSQNISELITHSKYSINLVDGRSITADREEVITLLQRLDNDEKVAAVNGHLIVLENIQSIDPIRE